MISNSPLASQFVSAIIITAGDQTSAQMASQCERVFAQIALDISSHLISSVSSNRVVYIQSEIITRFKGAKMKESIYRVTAYPDTHMHVKFG